MGRVREELSRQRQQRLQTPRARWKNCITKCLVAEGAGVLGGSEHLWWQGHRASWLQGEQHLLELWNRPDWRMRLRHGRRRGFLNKNKIRPQEKGKLEDSRSSSEQQGVDQKWTQSWQGEWMLCASMLKVALAFTQGPGLQHVTSTSPTSNASPEQSLPRYFHCLP